MTRHILPILLSGAAISLSACGGATTGGANGESISLGPTQSLSARSFVQGADTLDYSPGARNAELGGFVVSDIDNDALVERGAAGVYSDENDLFKSTIAENSSVYAVVSATDGVTPDVAGGAYGRFGASGIPISGQARFDGDYAGMVIEDHTASSQSVPLLLTGDASVTVDFTNDRIAGSITDRRAYFPNGDRNGAYAVNDVGIQTGTVDTGGAFSTTASGGALVTSGQSWSTSNGTVNGVIGGADGDSAAGVVFLRHSLQGSNTVFAERGSFVAERD